MLIAFSILAALIIALIVYLRVAGGGRFPWIQFYTKGKEAGFTFHEVGLLRRVAVENKLTNPTALFWSLKQLDRSVKNVILKLRATNREEEPEGSSLVGKLFDLRKRVALEQPRYTVGIKSSKNLTTRQRLKVMLPSLGPFQSEIVETLPRYMAFSYPKGPDLPEGFSWKDQRIGIHFWRAEDAGYFFQTKVLEDYIDRQYPIIHVAHSDGLVRTQMRKSVRVPTDLGAEVFPLKSIEAANEAPEQSRGLRCRLQDLSEDGIALFIGGRAKAGLAIKVQFEVSGKQVVMCGVVKKADFDGKRNRSVLHMQAVPLSVTTRNHVLIYVYNLFGDREGPQAQKAGGKR